MVAIMLREHTEATGLDNGVALVYYWESMAPLYDEIRRAIEASDKSRYVMAKETGISQSHLSQFMDGTKGLSVGALEKLADCMGLEITARPMRRRKRR